MQFKLKRNTSFSSRNKGRVCVLQVTRPYQPLYKSVGLCKLKMHQKGVRDMSSYMLKALLCIFFISEESIL